MAGMRPPRPLPLRPPARSCMPCHQRKVRCDKKTPCSACVRGDHRCVYPSPGGSTDSPRRRPKSTIADIAGRLSQLEGTIISLAGETHQVVPRTTSREADGLSNHDSPIGFARGLRSGDESNEYVNEVLLSCALEEEEEGDGQKDESRPAERPHDECTPGTRIRTAMESPIGFPFNCSSGPVSALGLLPPRGTTSQLWRVFVQNTTGLLCLLHIPTTQTTVFTAIDNPSGAPADSVCLLHAICFSAITSMYPAEAAILLGMPKAEALGRAKTGFETGLAAANIMEQPTVTALQAIALFLEALRAHRILRSDWAFLGLAVRLAQSLGVHRDGSAFPRMSLFEAEMRRRLWWHLVGQDKRAAEDHGFVTDSFSFASSSFPSNGTSTRDADSPRLPLHIDDSALYPAMTTMPPPATYFCSTTHFLIMVQASLALQQLSAFIIAGASDAARQHIVDELMERVRPLLGYLNPVIPEQRIALLACQIVLAKRDFVSKAQLLSRHPWSRGDDGAGSNDAGFVNGAAVQPATTTKVALMEASLVVACDILDMNHEVYTDELLRNFRWLAECYQQYHPLLYVLWYLNVRPLCGPHVERAWRAVDRLFEHEATRAWRQDMLPNMSENTASLAREYRPTGPWWVVFLRLRDKASRARAVAADEAKATTAAAAANITKAPEMQGPGAADGISSSEPVPVTIGAATQITSEGAVSTTSQREARDYVMGDVTWRDQEGLIDSHDNSITPREQSVGWQSDVQDWDALLSDFASQDYSFWQAP
ncbi:C6 transcription factor AsaR [Microdochium nivale]|nr:C6 transcription factor AsaR [Microdochium nivale]